jgi:AraC family transcriptional regulator
MQPEKPALSGPLGPLELRKLLPFEPWAVSDRLGWVGLDAARYREVPPFDVHVPPLTHHTFTLLSRPPEELEVHFQGTRRKLSPSPGSVVVVPAGCPVWMRSSGCKNALIIMLEPAVVARIAVEAFALDPAQVTVPPLDVQDLPQLRGALLAVDAELTSGGAGGRLASESLANVLAVHLIRYVSAPCYSVRSADGTLPRGRLRVVLTYIEERLDTNPTLEEMAAVVHLSPYHFARQFKAATGLPPYRYVIARRVQRAQVLLLGSELSLAEVAAQCGFSDQSQLSHHFKRLVGDTPRQFRSSARNA